MYSLLDSQCGYPDRRKEIEKKCAKWMKLVSGRRKIQASRITDTVRLDFSSTTVDSAISRKLNGFYRFLSDDPGTVW